MVGPSISVSDKMIQPDCCNFNFTKFCTAIVLACGLIKTKALFIKETGVVLSHVVPTPPPFVEHTWLAVDDDDDDEAVTKYPRCWRVKNVAVNANKTKSAVIILAIFDYFYLYLYACKSNYNFDYYYSFLLVFVWAKYKIYGVNEYFFVVVLGGAIV